MIRWMLAIFVAASLCAAGLVVLLSLEPSTEMLSRMEASDQATPSRHTNKEQPAQLQGPAAGETVPATVRNVTPDWVTGPSQVPNDVLERIPGRPVFESPDDEDEEPQDHHTRVLVLDAGRIRAGSMTLVLSDVKTLPFTAYCIDPIGGADWPCGRHARGELRRLIGSRSVVCGPADPNAQPSAGFLEQQALISSLSEDTQNIGRAGPTPADPTSAGQASAGVSQADTTGERYGSGEAPRQMPPRGLYEAGTGASSPSDFASRSTASYNPQRLDSDAFEPSLADEQAGLVPSPGHAASEALSQRPSQQVDGRRNATIRIRTQDARCKTGETAIGPWLTAQGWAVPANHLHEDEVYLTALMTARREARGIWRDPVGAWCRGPCRSNPAEMFDLPHALAALESGHPIPQRGDLQPINALPDVLKQSESDGFEPGTTPSALSEIVPDANALLANDDVEDGSVTPGEEGANTVYRPGALID